jgi:hypothetical protein
MYDFDSAHSKTDLSEQSHRIHIFRPLKLRQSTLHSSSAHYQKSIPRSDLCRWLSVVGFKEIPGKSIAVPSSSLFYLLDLIQAVQQERLDPNQTSSNFCSLSV